MASAEVWDIQLCRIGRRSRAVTPMQLPLAFWPLFRFWKKRPTIMLERKYDKCLAYVVVTILYRTTCQLINYTYQLVYFSKTPNACLLEQDLR